MIEVPCPHPKCFVLIPVSEGTAAGEYRCLCHASRVRLVWDGDGAPGLELLGPGRP